MGIDEMHIPEMTEQQWEVIVEQTTNVTGSLEGRRILYLKGDDTLCSVPISELKNVKNFEMSPISLKELGVLVTKNIKEEKLKTFVLNLLPTEVFFTEKKLDSIAEKFLEDRAKAMRSQEVSSSHPLYQFTDLLKNSEKNPFPHGGIYLSHLDGVTLEDGMLHVASKQIDNKKIDIIDFKIHPNERDKIKNDISLIKSNLEAFQSLLGNDAKITVAKGEYRYLVQKEGVFDSTKYKKLDDTLEFTFEGVGKLSMGLNDTNGWLYNHISIELPHGLKDGEALKSIQMMLACLGLEGILTSSKEEDRQKRTILQLFRNYHPKAAVEFESSKKLMELTPQELQKKICDMEPAMMSIFDDCFSKKLLKEEEIYPGMMSTTLTTQSAAMRKMGALGLMSGAKTTDSADDVNRLVKIIKNGHQCSQNRFGQGDLKEGVSSVADHFNGSAGYVFTRLIGQKTLQKMDKYEFDMEAIPYADNCQFLYDLDAINLDSYCYDTDRGGQRNFWDSSSMEKYQNRPTLQGLCNELRKTQINNRMHLGNEVLIKSWLPSRHLRAVVVQNSGMKKILIKALENEGLITQDKDNQSWICGKKVEEFIYCAEKFTKEMWDKPKSFVS